MLELALTGCVNLRYISVRSTAKAIDVTKAYRSWLQRLLQVLDFEDGGLKFLSSCFYDCFRVYGAKSARRRVAPEDAMRFLEELQRQCSRAARSGRAAFESQGYEIAGVRVSIEYTTGGITTARIL